MVSVTGRDGLSFDRVAFHTKVNSLSCSQKQLPPAGALYVPGAIVIPTAYTPSPNEVACEPVGGSGDHVPQLCDLKPASVGRIVTIAGPAMLALASVLFGDPVRS